METGFFLRDAKDGHREYDCPDTSLKNDMIKTINSVFGPVQALLSLAESDMLNLGLRMFNTLINQIFNLIASIEQYRGSEFCSGILFGIAGSNLVLNLGRDIMEGIDGFEMYMYKTATKPRLGKK